MDWKRHLYLRTDWTTYEKDCRGIKWVEWKECPAWGKGKIDQRAISEDIVADNNDG